MREVREEVRWESGERVGVIVDLWEGGGRGHWWVRWEGFDLYI